MKSNRFYERPDVFIIPPNYPVVSYSYFISAFPFDFIDHKFVATIGVDSARDIELYCVLRQTARIRSII